MADAQLSWSEQLRNEALLLRHQLAINDQGLSAEQRLSFGRVWNSLTNEDVLWRAMVMANEETWATGAEAMFARWRQEDSTRILARLDHASGETRRQELEVDEFQRTPCIGWACLLHASQLGGVGCSRVAELCAEACSVTRSSRPGERPSATMSIPALRGLLRALHEAGGASTLADEPISTAICETLAADLDSPPHSDAGDENHVPHGTVLAFLLLLVDRAGAMERLTLVLDAVVPSHTLARPAPLTLAEQRWLFDQLASATHAGLSTARKLAVWLGSADTTGESAGSSDSPSSPREYPHAPPATAHSAFKLRPRAWVDYPPDAQEFAVWCATVEKDTIGAALVGCCEAAAAPRDAVEEDGERRDEDALR